MKRQSAIVNEIAAAGICQHYTPYPIAPIPQAPSLTVPHDEAFCEALRRREDVALMTPGGDRRSLRDLPDHEERVGCMECGCKWLRAFDAWRAKAFEKENTRGDPIGRIVGARSDVPICFRVQPGASCDCRSWRGITQAIHGCGEINCTRGKFEK
jgi:hypothetical protein